MRRGRPLQASIDLAAAIADMPPVSRLLAYEQLLACPDKLDGISKTASLHVNAEVTTLLRQLDIIPFPVTAVEYV